MTIDPAAVMPPPHRPLELVVLVSGSGTLLQALLDDPRRGTHFEVVGVGADRDCTGLERAFRAGVPTFTVDVADFPTRTDWDAALSDAIERAFGDSFDDESVRTLVVSAGFMKIIGAATLGAHDVINTHPALLPSFPGAHGVRDALAYGVKVTGTTCHFVDAGVDTGPIITQRVVEIAPDDTEDSLHERIKVQERQMLADVVTTLSAGWTINGRTVSLP